MKHFGLMTLLLLAASCGEPTEYYAKSTFKAVSMPVSATPEEFKNPIMVDDGLSIKTGDKPVSRSIQITNLDPDNTYVIEYKLERDDSIRLKNPVLVKEELSGSLSTKVPVVFTPDANSTIKVDQLVITYYKKGEPEGKRSILYPINAESATRVGVASTGVVSHVPSSATAAIPNVQIARREYQDGLEALPSQGVVSYVSATAAAAKPDVRIARRNYQDGLEELTARGPVTHASASATAAKPDVRIARRNYQDGLEELTARGLVTQASATATADKPDIRIARRNYQDGLEELTARGLVTQASASATADKPDVRIARRNYQDGLEELTARGLVTQASASATADKPDVRIARRNYQDAINLFATNGLVSILSAKPEGLASIDTRVSSVYVRSMSGAPVLDLGRTVVGNTIEGKVLITNTSPFDINLDLRIGQDDSLVIKESTCAEILIQGADCIVTIEFDGKKPGTLEDKLIVEHKAKNTHEINTNPFPVIGSKIEDLDRCGNNPCGVPFKEGTLIASEVFSNNIDFGSVAVGVEVKKQVEIQNKGDTALNLKDFALENEVFSFSGGKYPGIKGTCGDIILPGSCILEMAYLPVARNRDQGSLKVSTKDGPSVVLKFIGQGVEKKSCDTFHEYLVVPEKSYPAASVVFPYLNAKSTTKAKLSSLYGMQVNSYVPQIKEHTVKDGMVYLTFKLPEMEGEIVNMNFGVNVYKVIRDNYKDTESLCLSSSSVRKCSGQEFTLKAWQELKNPKFWNMFKIPVNRKYEEQFLSGENKCGSKNCMALNTTYELKEIFDLSTEEFATIRSESLFSLITSDDTRMVTMPRISVRTKVTQECK